MLWKVSCESRLGWQVPPPPQSLSGLPTPPTLQKQKAVLARAAELGLLHGVHALLSGLRVTASRSGPQRLCGGGTGRSHPVRCVGAAPCRSGCLSS